MKLQVKKWGDSMVIVLPIPFLVYHELSEGDWLDLSDAVKDHKYKFMGEKD